jgi:hypothetical protein
MQQPYSIRRDPCHKKNGLATGSTCASSQPILRATIAGFNPQIVIYVMAITTMCRDS